MAHSQLSISKRLHKIISLALLSKCYIFLLCKECYQFLFGTDLHPWSLSVSSKCLTSHSCSLSHCSSVEGRFSFCLRMNININLRLLVRKLQLYHHIFAIRLLSRSHQTKYSSTNIDVGKFIKFFTSLNNNYHTFTLYLFTYLHFLPSFHFQHQFLSRHPVVFPVLLLISQLSFTVCLLQINLPLDQKSNL